jgi:hypothetical protein
MPTGTPNAAARETRHQTRQPSHWGGGHVAGDGGGILRPRGRQRHRQPRVCGIRAGARTIALGGAQIRAHVRDVVTDESAPVEVQGDARGDTGSEAGPSRPR